MLGTNSGALGNSKSSFQPRECSTSTVKTFLLHLFVGECVCVCVCARSDMCVTEDNLLELDLSFFFVEPGAGTTLSQGHTLTL